MAASRRKLKTVAKLTFPAKLEYLESMLKFVRNVAEKLSFGGKEINQIQIAAEEVLANIISYAYPNEGGSIEITCDIEEGKRLVIQTVDWGVPFDPLSLPDPDIEAPIEERDIGGLGVFMMRQIMDEVSYKREGERNILTLAKC